ncbi:TonB-dependent receptor [Pedobacter hiemivivus]|uniref:TonB-dependent receptor n=1 Tax=Pedobacter hiemivivus TaxID=2530454 RepID=A0A4U1GBV7_9SPHI|nr:TonB-dependent receptor [Pedobacter hiemivivus]TKC58632.1 TonB-dependent receptor [Pedobacter hiemivivus]
MIKLKLKKCNLLSLRVAKTLLASVFIVLLVCTGDAVTAKGMLAPITITGKVVDSNGEAIIGATIKSSAGGGAVTDANGNYTLKTESNATLTFSFIGYVSQEIKINNRTKINITLASSLNQLNDVVVIGYGTQKRKDVTGAITTIRLEDSPKSAVPFINPLEAMQGTAGINIGPSTSAGATPNIVVRGQNSINANISPLIVLDGVIFNGNLNDINMNDIATYDILKDASSAAIYGSRSANGVVLITTKRGRTDKPTINFSTYYGIQNWTRVPEMRKGEDFLQWRKDNLSIRGTDISDITKVLSPLELKAYNEGHELDWMDEVSQYAPIGNYQLSVSGKTNNLNYYFSGGYLNQKGVMYNDSFKKPNFTVKLENNITDWLSYGVNGYYSSLDYSGYSPGLYMATYMSPYSYKYVEGREGDLLQRYPAGNTSLFNPLWGNNTELTRGVYDDNLERSYSIQGTGFLNIKVPFIKGLNYRFDVTGRKSTSDLANFHHEGAEVNTLVPAQIANPTQFLNKTSGFKDNEVSSSWLINNLLSYTRSFGQHNIDALLGYTRESYQSETVRLNGLDFTNAGTTALSYNGLEFATTKTGYTRNGGYANVGYIGRLNYNYAQKYYATLNVRRDGFSAFAEGHKFGWFPGGSVAWALSEEGFMKSLKFVNYLKARISYGNTGNQGIAPLATQALVDPGFTVFGSTSTAYMTPSTLANEILTWEKTAALNFGLDFSLFDNRVSGNIDVYKSKTTDQLLVRGLPVFTGFSKVNANMGEVQNKGIEITVNTVNIKSEGGFKWQSGLSFWMNRNKLVHLYGTDVDGNGIEDDNVGLSLFIGKSLGANYDYTVDGIVQSSDTEYMNKYKTQSGVNIFAPGDLKIRDLNNDGVIDPKDRSIIGYGKENFNFNISNTFMYKNFQLYFSINSIVGGGKNNFFSSTNLRGLNPGQTLPTQANWLNDEYWMPDRESNKNPRPNYSNPYGYGFYQSRTFARLQNASLSYTFPKPITEKLKVNDLKVFVSGTNLITLTGWTGLDPANGAQIGGNGGSSSSTVNTSLPLMRTVSFGLNVGF